MPRSQYCLLALDYDAVLAELYDFVDVHGFNFDGSINKLGKEAQRMYDMVWQLKFKPDDLELYRLEKYEKQLVKFKEYCKKTSRGEKAKLSKDISMFSGSRPKTSFLLRTYLKLAKMFKPALLYEDEVEETYDERQIKRNRNLDYVEHKNKIVNAHNRVVYDYYARKYHTSVEMFQLDVDDALKRAAKKKEELNKKLELERAKKGLVIDDD